MKFLLAIIDALISFVQRNPLTVLIILILAIGAPALLKGIAVFILYLFMGFMLLVVALIFFMRWRLGKMRKQMEEQFGGEYRQRGGAGWPFGAPRQEPAGREGDVKIYKTNETPEKKVSSQVGDYVEFEEEK